ncbi:protein ITPRID2 [Cetorhinus maximus]
MEEAVLSGCAHSWRNAKDKRKAWARSRDSWQISETDDRCVATETTVLSEDNSSANLELSGTSAEENGISNKKIEIWLQDCGTPLGASLDEQSQIALKSTVTKNGCSFEDDLSLGAEANYLHSRSDSMSAPSHGTSAKEKRKQFYQMGNSMNSTGSGKSSTTVSSVSELLDLYEEDPEDVLFNLGFGTDEPDLASKIPCRFFNAASFARGIDFKLFLDAQMQRMELDNPNFALTSRFRQIKVLTTVANVFSSLYSQVSGAPIKRIGSMTEDPAAGEAPAIGNSAAGRLKKTVSNLNLLGPLQVKRTETSNQAESPDTENSKASQSSGTNENITDNEKKEEVKQKKEARLQKWRKLTDTSLRTVTEEVMGGGDSPFSPSDPNPQGAACNITDQTESMQSGAVSTEEGSGNRLHDKSGISDSTNTEDLNTSTNMELEAIDEQTSVPSQGCAEIVSTRPVCSTPDKGPAAAVQHPLVKTLMEEQREFSFDLEEVQSNEGEGTNVPATKNPAPHDRVSAANKKHFARTSSSHSDSSGFAEDPSSDLAGQCQGPDGYLQAMGSSADSCDSETTVTSLIDDLKTPLSCDQQFFTPFQTPVENMTLDLKETILDLKAELIPDAVVDSHEQGEVVLNDCKEAAGVGNSIQPGEQRALGFTGKEYSSQDEMELYPESDMKWESESDIPTYSVHHRVGRRQDRLEPAALNTNVAETMNFSSISIDKITTVLERAKTKTYSVSSTSGRARRPVTKASDRIMREGEGLPKNESLAAMKRSTFQRSSSLPTTLLSPVRVVSSLNVQLTPESGSRCSSPCFTYKYAALREKEMPINDENEQSTCRSMLFIPSTKRESRKQFTLNRHDETPQHRLSSQSLSMPSHSCCSLHALPSDWQGQPLCDHMRTRSMCSLPNLIEPTCTTCTAPFGHLSPQRPMAHSYHHIPINPPSAIESQLCRVLNEIRSTVQNLVRIPIFQGRDQLFPYSTSRLGLLPLYETTYQELQIMRRNLNFFRTQMMDLEFVMLRQQTLVYQHLTDEERQEADQLQNLRNCVRMELQELEMQLDERSFALEDQLKAPNQYTMFNPPPRARAYTHNTDTMSSSSLNVMEPVTELLREQSYLRSELGFSEPSGDEYEYPQSYSTPYTNLESTSRCSSPGRMSRYSSSLGHGHQGVPSTTVQYGKPANLATSSSQTKQVYRSSVMLTPSTPARVEQGEQFTEDRCSPGVEDLKSVSEKSELKGATAVPIAKEARSNIVDHPEFQTVLQEIKESLAGEIKREIMDGLLAAISPTGSSAVGQREEFS